MKKILLSGILFFSILGISAQNMNDYLQLIKNEPAMATIVSIDYKKSKKEFTFQTTNGSIVPIYNETDFLETEWFTDASGIQNRVMAKTFAGATHTYMWVNWETMEGYGKDNSRFQIFQFSNGSYVDVTYSLMPNKGLNVVYETLGIEPQFEEDLYAIPLFVGNMDQFTFLLYTYSVDQQCMAYDTNPDYQTACNFLETLNGNLFYPLTWDATTETFKKAD